MKKMLVKIAPNTDDDQPNFASPDAKWIAVKGIGIKDFEKLPTITDKFFAIRPHIPKGWHPIGFERRGRK